MNMNTRASAKIKGLRGSTQLVQHTVQEYSMNAKKKQEIGEKAKNLYTTY